MKKLNSIIFLMMFCSTASFVSAGMDMGKMLADMGKGIIGYPPVGYSYSCEIWSDANVPIYTAQQGIASYMGAFFPSIKGFYGQKKMASIFDVENNPEKAVYTNSKYYFKLYIADNNDPQKDSIFTQNVTQLPLKKHDPTVFYYHVYTAPDFSSGKRKHRQKVESMGYQNPQELDSDDIAKRGNVKISGQLSSVAFVNSSGKDVQVSLTYGKKPYTFTVEKYSYASMAVPMEEPEEKESATTQVEVPSTEPGVKIQSVKNAEVVIQKGVQDKENDPKPLFSLRPNRITFSVRNSNQDPYKEFTAFNIPAEGFDGTSYTIEIYEEADKKMNVCVQGFNIGNYDQGATPRNRDITPCSCTFWYQSFAQAGSIPGYLDLPGQIWVVYAGADSMISSKVVPGQVVSWDLTRPLLAQGDQLVHFVYVVTQDDAKAQNFVNKFVQQLVGKDVYTTYKKAIDVPFGQVRENTELQGTNAQDDTGTKLSPITAAQQVATLMGELSISQGIIEDKEQGIIGYMVGADVFTPKGVGAGKFNYVLSPSVMSLTTIVSLLSSSCDTAKMSALSLNKDGLQDALTTTVQKWIDAYIQDQKIAQAQVEQFLQKYGNDKVVDARGALTKFGNDRVELLVSGGISLKFPPMKLSTVTNYYVYDFGKSKPDKMPEKVIQLNDPGVAEKAPVK